MRLDQAQHVGGDFQSAHSPLHREVIAQIFVSGIREHGHYHPFLQFTGYAQGRSHRRPGGDAHEQPLFPCQPPHHLVRLFRLHFQVAVGHFLIVDPRPDCRRHVLQPFQPVERILRLETDQLHRGCSLRRKRPVPINVPEVPIPATKCVIPDRVCARISGPVE